MKKSIPMIIIVVIVSCILAGGFWFYYTKISHTAIADILKNPRDYEGQLLTIEGQVTGVTSFFVIKSYRVKDDTGELTVTTKRFLPTVGEKIRIKGTIDSAFSVGTEEVLVLIESEKVN